MARANDASSDSDGGVIVEIILVVVIAIVIVAIEIVVIAAIIGWIQYNEHYTCHLNTSVTAIVTAIQPLLLANLI